MGFPIRFECGSCHQQEHALVGTKRMLHRAWRDVMPAKRVVKTLQVAGRGKIGLLNLVHARQRVEVRRLPTAILDNKPGDEICGRPGTRSYEILPCRFRGRSARSKNSSRSHADFAAVKVQDRG